MELVPYIASNEVLPVRQAPHLETDLYQAVHFTVSAEQLDWFLGKIERWFDDREEVILVGSGVSMQGDGFIVLEWEGYEIDPLFLKILEHEDTVTDICVYTHS